MVHNLKYREITTLLHLIKQSGYNVHIVAVFQDKRGPTNAASHQLMHSCLENLQRAMKGECATCTKAQQRTMTI